MNRAFKWVGMAAGACGLSVAAQTVDSALSGGLLDPQSVALDAQRNVYVADRGHHRIVRLSRATGEISILAGSGNPGAANGTGAGAAFNLPSGIVAARGGLVVADSGNHTLRWVGFDGRVTDFAGLAGQSGWLDAADPLAARFRWPAGLAADAGGNLYVADAKNSAVRKIDVLNAVSTLAGPTNGLFEPAALTVDGDGVVVVADTRNHSIRTIRAPGSVALLAGGGSAAARGSEDSLDAQAALFDSPRGLFWADRSLGFLVSDSGNHTLRRIYANAQTGTWSVQTIAGSAGEPGRIDGLALAARFSTPAGLAWDSIGGSLWVADLGNGALRRLRVGLTTAGPEGQVVVPSPQIEPASGYYPAGTDVEVRSSVPDVRYTTDGSEPTTSSPAVPLDAGRGTIAWRQSQRDLTSLRLKAFDGTNASVTVGGVPAPASQIGLFRDYRAGIGATAVLPVVLNLRSSDLVRSLQFRVEVTPHAGNTGAKTLAADQLSAMGISPSDFIPVVAPSVPGLTASFSRTAYAVEGGGRGLALAFIGTNANLMASNFAAGAMLAVRIPPSAAVGDRFDVRVKEPSATRDGGSEPVALDPEPAVRGIDVVNLDYTVGDSVPTGWYNAGDFGDGDLSNNDVNIAFYAALGIRIPYTFSDVFDAMDVFPEDSAISVGGDGEIRFLDWQRVLRRSLRLPGSTNNWSRHWVAGGERRATVANLRGQPNAAAQIHRASRAVAEPALWYRQASLSAGSLGNAGSGQVVSVPIVARVAGGASLSGLLFSVEVIPEGDALPLERAVRFLTAEGVPQGHLASAGLNQVGYGWDLGAFTPALTGRNLLGVLEFQLPQWAARGHRYTIRFAKADGSPDLNTQYDWETFSGTVVVAAPAPVPDGLSDDWKIAFFGALDDPRASASADPDGDGFTNLQEYLIGTHPLRADSALRLEAWPADPADPPAGVLLRWRSAANRGYVIESSPSLQPAAWTLVRAGVTGAGVVQEVSVQAPVGAPMLLYRIRLEP